jgi:adenine-specific DNA-methyltransferase
MTNELPEKLPLTPTDIAAEKRDELRRILAATFPEAVSEDNIDFDQLKRVLGEWVEPDRERFGLNWPGKAGCMKVIQAPSVGTLTPFPEESVEWDATQNLFIEGDNLEALKLLQKAYFGKVKMIYVDPPYNTGNEFIYPDNYAETLATYLEYSGQQDDTGKRFSTNTDSSGRFHSRWLNMMYPRLYLAKNLLKNDGLIFISIDDNEHANLKELCDQIFGEENFVDCIIWKKRYGGGAKEKYLVTLHEYILVYARDIKELGEIFVPLREGAVEQYYKCSDEHFESKGPYRTHPLEAMKSFDERENLNFPIPAPDGTQVFPKRQWRWGPARVAEALAKGEIDFSKNRNGEWVLSSKQYLKGDSGEIRKTKQFSVIDDIYSQHGTNEIVKIFGDAKIFDFPKPSALIQKLVSVGTNISSGDLVCDFFAGSNSTGHAVMAQNVLDGGNRKFLTIQLPEVCAPDSAAARAGFKNIAEISKERLRRSATIIASENLLWDGDLGFRCFKLEESAFHQWRGDFDEEGEATLLSKIAEHAEHLNPTASEQKLLFEILLRDGFYLSEKAVVIQVGGKVAYSVAAGAMIICLDMALTQEAIDAMADLEPARVICLDAGFQGNDQLKANAVQTFKARARSRETAIEFRTV